MTNGVEVLGVDPATGRELSYVRLATAADLQREHLPPRPFACLLAWHVDTATNAELARIARLLRDAGCGYVCAHGRGSSRVDDAVDEEGISMQLDEGLRVPFVMTTWHDDEPIADTLFFFLVHTSIEDATDDPDYLPWGAECRHAVVVDIGGALGDGREVRAALRDPTAFCTGR